MRFSASFCTSLVLLGRVAAQGDLAALLATQPDLSALLHAVSTVRGLNATLSATSNITIFAPINSAFEEVASQDSPEAEALNNRNSTTIEALLVRHVFQGYYPAEVVTESPAWIQSLLTPEYRNDVQPFANTTGGAYAGVVRNRANVNVISGELTVSNVVEADIRLGEGIIIHKVDKALVFNPPVTLYAARSGYSAFQGAADQAGLSQELDISIPDITVFVPINDAFNAIGSIVSSVDKATLTSVLQYHVIPNTIAYSNQLGNVTVPTLEGSDLTISVTDDAIFVNQAKVLFANVLIPNGVAHVIDSVLNPADSSFDRSDLDAIASLPAASRVAYDGATPTSTLVFAISNAPLVSTALDSVGEFTASTGFVYSTPVLLSTWNVLPATTTPSASTNLSTAAFTGVAHPLRVRNHFLAVAAVAAGAAILV